MSPVKKITLSLKQEELPKEIISRDEAIRRGLNFYYTGKKCDQGHLDRICIKKLQCKTCISIYNKKYREKNRDHIAKQKKEWVLKNLSYVRQKEKITYLKTREKKIQTSRAFYAQNKEKVLLQTKEYREKNKDLIRQRQKKCFHFSNLQPLWYEDNLKKGSKLVRK